MRTFYTLSYHTDTARELDLASHRTPFYESPFQATFRPRFGRGGKVICVQGESVAVTDYDGLRLHLLNPSTRKVLPAYPSDYHVAIDRDQFNLLPRHPRPPKEYAHYRVWKRWRVLESATKWVLEAFTLYPTMYRILRHSHEIMGESALAIRDEGHFNQWLAWTGRNTDFWSVSDKIIAFAFNFMPMGCSNKHRTLLCQEKRWAEGQQLLYEVYVSLAALRQTRRIAAMRRSRGES